MTEMAYLEKSFDKQLIYIIADETTYSICDDVQILHRSAESHFFLEDFRKECVKQHNLNEVVKFDFWECCHKAETEGGKDAKMQNFVDTAEHKPIFMVFFSRPEEHISKKCPINGQYLTEYF